ncbi:MAG: hypothetical protein P8Z37_18805 [Acidobacteriota bacterium]|jgi:hypothetical protein
MEPVFVILFIAVAVALAIYAYLANKKRQEALRNIAARLGLDFDPAKNRAVARQFEFIDRTRKGRNRYAFNIFRGSFQEHPVEVFEYHYKAGSGKNTHHYYLSFFIVKLPISVPELTIGPEGFFSKIAQAIGYDDIDFESHEFSRRFCVRSRDKKFAYDICHGRMIEYLLGNPDLTIEMEREVLAVSFSGKLDLDRFEHNLKRLIRLRTLIPDYVINRS